MFHLINSHSLYDLMNETKIELNLFKDKEKFDIAQFLDDVSLWMDKNREYISDNYLPFSILSVGVIPIQVSAFMYGLFVGKAIEKHGLTVKSIVTKVDKDTILKDIERNINYYNGLMGGSLRDHLREEKDDTSQAGPGQECDK